MHVPKPRKGMPDPKLDHAAFRSRYLEQFRDSAFDPMREAIDAIADAAWDAYDNSRKSPQTIKAGPGFADPDYDLATDWVAAKAAIDAARAENEDRDGPCRFLLVNGSGRSEHTCPGEMSKSWRLIKLAEQVLSADDSKVEILDLSRLASEYGRNIHPCKACFSTAAALCHFPCSCYPNHSLGQTQDWMNEIYPMWVRAHGVMIVTPVNWYSPTSGLKLMMDRMVCCDGGNPDPSSTHGKHADEAKALELKGWDYPRHLEGRCFSVVVHGDVEGAENVRRAIADWLRFMQLCPAGVKAELDRYIGYWEPYATSHEALDKDEGIQGEVRNAAATLLEAVRQARSGMMINAGSHLKAPREK